MDQFNPLGAAEKTLKHVFSSLGPTRSSILKTHWALFTMISSWEPCVGSRTAGKAMEEEGEYRGASGSALVPGPEV